MTEAERQRQERELARYVAEQRSVPAALIGRRHTRAEKRRAKRRADTERRRPE